MISKVVKKATYWQRQKRIHKITLTLLLQPSILHVLCAGFYISWRWKKNKKGDEL
jgi:hypothetical protein